MMESQVKLLRKNLILENEEILKLFGTVDAESDSVRTEMRTMWKKLNVEPIEMPIPHMGGTHVSIAFGLAVHLIYNNYVKHNTHISAIFENDVMVVNPVSLNKYSSDYQMCGDVRFYTSYLPVRIFHFWIGLMIFNHHKFKDIELFDPRQQSIFLDGKEYNADCGSPTYFWLLKNKNEVKHINNIGPDHLLKNYSPYESSVCIIHSITDDVQYLPPRVNKELYQPSFISVNYDNIFLHLSRMTEGHLKDRPNKVEWLNKICEENM